MKLVTRTPDERVRGFERSTGSEKRFRHPALEEISEVSCCMGPQRWTENDQPGDADGPDVWFPDSLS